MKVGDLITWKHSRLDHDGIGVIVGTAPSPVMGGVWFKVAWQWFIRGGKKEINTTTWEGCESLKTIHTGKR